MKPSARGVVERRAREGIGVELHNVGLQGVCM